MIIKELCSFRNSSYVIIKSPDVLNGLGPDVETELRECWWNIVPGDVVVDAGAGLGMWTLPALAAGAASVYAFEPEQAQTSLLKQSLVENGWTACTEIIESFLGCDEGERYVHGRMISVTSLDAFIEKQSIVKCNWIKIDVEGMELDVLSGAQNTIYNLKPKMIVENHLFMDQTLESQAIDFIKGICGYSAETINSGAVSHTLFVPE